MELYRIKKVFPAFGVVLSELLLDLLNQFAVKLAAHRFCEQCIDRCTALRRHFLLRFQSGISSVVAPARNTGVAAGVVRLFHHNDALAGFSGRYGCRKTSAPGANNDDIGRFFHRVG